MFGFFNINKPPGPTSHDIVNAVRRMLPGGVKVGHAGTLDPFAEGVLVVCAGAASRLASFVQAGTKRYIAGVFLGAVSTTDDSLGAITPAAGRDFPARAGVEAALDGFRGDFRQVPPAYSAVHVNGRRAYKLARSGAEFSLSPRPVRVEAVNLLAYEPPRLKIEVICSTGTYIRSIARDLGTALGTGGYCESLTRTAVGCFDIKDSIRPGELNPAEHLLKPLLAVKDMPAVHLDRRRADIARNGGRLPLAETLPPGKAAILDHRGELMAIGDVLSDGLTLKPVTVLLRNDASPP